MENLEESQFPRFRDENIADLAFKVVVNKTNLPGRRLLTVHNYTFKFSHFYIFRLNWVGCLLHCITGTFKKQSFLYRDVP